MIGSAKTVVLALLTVVFGVGMVAFGLYAGLMAYYHPNAPLSPYARPLLYGSVTWTVVALILAIRLGIVSRRRTSRQSTNELRLFWAAVAVFAAGVIFGVEPIPQYRYQILADEEVYWVPSRYTMLDRNTSSISIDYCANDLSGIYQWHFGGCDHVDAKLSRDKDVVELGWALLDRKLRVPRDGDRLLSFDNIPFDRQESDGGIVFTGRNVNKRDYFIQIASDGTVERLATCFVQSRRAYPCTVSAATDLGTLVYRAPNPAAFDPADFAAQENRILDLIRSWRAPPRPVIDASKRS